MPFGVVSGVSRGMGVLDGGGYRQRRRGSFGVKLGRPIVTNGAFTTRLFSTAAKCCPQQTDDCRLLVALGDGRRAATKFSKYRVLYNVPEKSALILHGGIP